MNQATWKLLDQDYQESFDRSGRHIVRAISLPSLEETSHAMNILEVQFDLDYRDFLLRYGGALVGALPIFGLRPVEAMGSNWSVIDETKRFREEGWPSAGFYVISIDGYGNPIAMNQEGEVYINEYDFGGIERIFDSFETFLLEFCLPI